MKAVLFGTGWRAHFYIRIASLLPSLLTISSVYTRSEERKSLILSEGLDATTDISAALSAEHDAVIVASGRDGFLPLLEELEKRGERILTETSFLPLSDEELARAGKIEGFAFEQYLHTPLYSSVMAALGRIGKVSSFYLSALHNHHAASLMNAVFPGLEIKDVKRLLEEKAECLKTGTRSGLVRTEEREEYTRKITSVTFGTGEVFITDFSSNQYHSYIIPSRLEIRGEKGVITERGVTYIDGEGYPVSLPFVFHRDEGKTGQQPSFSHVTLGDVTVFRNRFYPLPLSDDEIAIATMLEEYSHGVLTYTIRKAVDDARVGKLF